MNNGQEYTSSLGSPIKFNPEKNIEPIRSFLSDKNIFTKEKKIPKKSGVYVFWILASVLKDAQLEWVIQGKAHGNNYHRVKVVIDKEWLDKATYGDYVCLYVGKTTNLMGRISKHFKLQTPDIWKGQERENKPNTVSQLRIGIEKIFGKESSIKDCLGDISVSFVEMDGYSKSVDRFYLECEWIAKYKPLFNVDIER